ncbi:DUF4920 domain-containing protein [Taibaiella koreensis]|uniref:DUF4920 domain-containing protein n=1 Tax=Taibaiella koreensis TaxID=1268548 RepID=UPI000E59F0BE|nr:DUF4920 domain-containing protein [Taibaiella koreensis]
MMKKIILCSLLSASFGVVPAMAQTATAVSQAKVYGTVAPPVKPYSTHRLATIMQGQQSATLQLVGMAKEVCQKEGCWMTVGMDKRDGYDVLVKVKDHAFVLPKDITGRQVVVSGVVTQKTLSVAEQKHYLEDAGASREAIAKITEPKQVYEMEAVGVAVN